MSYEVWAFIFSRDRLIQIILFYSLASIEQYHIIFFIVPCLDTRGIILFSNKMPIDIFTESLNPEMQNILNYFTYIPQYRYFSYVSYRIHHQPGTGWHFPHSPDIVDIQHFWNTHLGKKFKQINDNTGGCYNLQDSPKISLLNISQVSVHTHSQKGYNVDVLTLMKAEKLIEFLGQRNRKICKWRRIYNIYILVVFSN